MFGRRARRAEFEREVRTEIELLTKLHGDDAARIAGEKAARPSNRTKRRLVLEEAHRRLGGAAPTVKHDLLTIIFG